MASIPSLSHREAAQTHLAELGLATSLLSQSAPTLGSLDSKRASHSSEAEEEDSLETPESLPVSFVSDGVGEIKSASSPILSLQTSDSPPTSPRTHKKMGIENIMSKKRTNKTREKAEIDKQKNKKVVESRGMNENPGRHDTTEWFGGREEAKVEFEIPITDEHPTTSPEAGDRREIPVKPFTKKSGPSRFKLGGTLISFSA